MSLPSSEVTNPDTLAGPVYLDPANEGGVTQETLYISPVVGMAVQNTPKVVGQGITSGGETTLKLSADEPIPSDSTVSSNSNIKIDPSVAYYWNGLFNRDAGIELL